MSKTQWTKTCQTGSAGIFDSYDILIIFFLQRILGKISFPKSPYMAKKSKGKNFYPAMQNVQFGQNRYL